MNTRSVFTLISTVSRMSSAYPPASVTCRDARLGERVADEDVALLEPPLGEGQPPEAVVHVRVGPGEHETELRAGPTERLRQRAPQLVEVTAVARSVGEIHLEVAGRA